MSKFIWMHGALALAMSFPTWAATDADLAEIREQIRQLKESYEARIQALEQKLKDAETAKSALAAADYKRNLELDPANVDAYWLLGEAYVDLGRKVDALQAYKLYQSRAAAPDPAVESRIHELEAELSVTSPATAAR